MREMQRPDLIDEAAAALQQAAEIILGDETVVLGITAILGAIARRGFELFPIRHVVAGEQRDAVIGAVDRDIGAALIVAHARRHRPAAQDEVLVPLAAILAFQDGGTLGCAYDERDAHGFLRFFERLAPSVPRRQPCLTTQ